MLQDIGEKVYHCEYAPVAPNPERDYLLAFNNGRALLIGGEDRQLPKLCQIHSNIDPTALQFAFTISGTSFFLYMKEDIPETEELKYDGINVLRGMRPLWMAFAGVTGYHLYRWYTSHKFCGGCGTPLEHKSDERELVCPNCGIEVYPGISPAVIVGIIWGNKLLLTRYAGRTGGSYALVAGFVEIGETLEDTVRREIFEEVGLKVKDIRYYDSQPWGFSQSVLTGFFAQLDGSDEIHLEQKELSEAVWVEREDIQPVNTDISLTSKMIEAFRHGEI